MESNFSLTILEPMSSSIVFSGKTISSTRIGIKNNWQNRYRFEMVFIEMRVK
jgi:hypothetical protein